MSLIAGGVIASGFYPIVLPDIMIESVNIILDHLLSMTGIIPAVDIFIALSFITLMELCIFIYKLFKWIVGS